MTHVPPAPRIAVSQFTLHARLNKGTKPDFHKSMVSRTGGARARSRAQEDCVCSLPPGPAGRRCSSNREASKHESSTRSSSRGWVRRTNPSASKVRAATRMGGVVRGRHEPKTGARWLYEATRAKQRQTLTPFALSDGAFGEMMQCSLTNDGASHVQPCERLLGDLRLT